VTRGKTLSISLAGATRTTFSGDITQVAMLDNEGGLARYRVRLTPSRWRLTQVRNSRVWQDKSVTDIVDDLLGAYKPLTQWRWSGGTDAFIADMPPRSYCCQYRETDYEFVQRLLTEEGLAWRIEKGIGICRGVASIMDRSRE
jgi:type VI secretion system secreted protein VgrG